MSNPMVELLLVGFPEANSKALRVALQNRAANICKLADLQSANIALIDIDNEPEPANWMKLSKERNIPLVAVSANGEVPARHRNLFQGQLKKPLHFSEMLDTICRVSGKGGSAMEAVRRASLVGTTIVDTLQTDQASPMVTAKQLADVVDMNLFLVGRVIEAIQSDGGEYRLIRWSDDQYVVIDKVANRAFFRIKQIVFRHFAILPIEKLGISEQWITRKESAELAEKNFWKSDLEELVWSLTQRTLGKKPPKSLDLNTTYQLRFWPNLARYSTGEIDVAMANYWTDNPSSVKDMARNLSLPMEIVIPFASCCHAIGLLRATNAAAADRKDSQTEDKGFRKVMSMILGKLRS